MIVCCSRQPAVSTPSAARQAGLDSLAVRNTGVCKHAVGWVPTAVEAMVPVGVGVGVADVAAGVGAVIPAPHVGGILEADPVVRELASGCIQGRICAMC
jgi:hypothetical protein